MANLSLRRSGPAALAATTLAAVVIGCGGGGGGGGSSTNGTTSSTTSGSTGTTTAGTTDTTTAGTSTGTLGGGNSATAPGALPQNSVFYAVSNGATFDVDYIKEDGTGGGTYAAGLSSLTPAVASPDPSAAGRFVFAATPTSDSTTFGLYRDTTQTPTSANTLVSARYAEIDSIDVARDGSKAVYIAATSLGGDLGLYSVSTAAGSAPALIANAYDAALDTDGTKVVYAADNGGQSDLYLRVLGGAASTALTSTTDVNEDEPQFSKDGTKVVFSETLADGTFRLGYVTAAGGAVTQINPFPPSNGDVVLRAPSFNAAGTRISFIAADSTDGSHSGLYTCDLSGANLIRVVASSQLLNATYWTTLQGRAIAGIPFHFGVAGKRKIAKP